MIIHLVSQSFEPGEEIGTIGEAVRVCGPADYHNINKISYLKSLVQSLPDAPFARSAETGGITESDPPQKPRFSAPPRQAERQKPLNPIRFS